MKGIEGEDRHRNTANTWSEVAGGEWSLLSSDSENMGMGESESEEISIGELKLKEIFIEELEPEKI